MVGSPCGLFPWTNALCIGVIDHNASGFRLKFTVQTQFAKGILVIDFQSVKASENRVQAGLPPGAHILLCSRAYTRLVVELGFFSGKVKGPP